MPYLLVPVCVLALPHAFTLFSPEVYKRLLEFLVVSFFDVGNTKTISENVYEISWSALWSEIDFHPLRSEQVLGETHGKVLALIFLLVTS